MALATEIARLRDQKAAVQKQVAAAIARRAAAEHPSDGEGRVLDHIHALLNPRQVGVASTNKHGMAARPTQLASARGRDSGRDVRDGGRDGATWADVTGFVRPWLPSEDCRDSVRLALPEGASAAASASHAVGPGLCAALHAIHPARRLEPASGVVRFRTSLAAATGGAGRGGELPLAVGRALARLDVVQAGLNRRRLKLYISQFGSAAPGENGSKGALGAAGTVAGALLHAVGLSPSAHVHEARNLPTHNWHQVAAAWDALGRGEQGELHLTPSSTHTGLTSLARSELAAGEAEQGAEGVVAARRRVPRAQRLVSGLDQVEAALLGAQERLMLSRMHH